MAAIGHREYVGGMWEEMGRSQFEFIKAQGLKPSDVLLDVACGALRGGVHFIRYLESGNYLGIDKEESLIRAGVEQELGDTLYKLKMPELVVSDSFEFGKFARKPNFALAQSLVTHIPASLTRLCLRNLRASVEPGCRFFVTFFESERPVDNPEIGHDHRTFMYTRDEMEGYGSEAGWGYVYIGEWGHPRGQRIVEYVAK